MHNDYVYETFGISKHFPVKLQELLIRAKTLDNPQTAKCFIYDVIGRFSFSFVIYVVNSGTSKIIGTLDLNAFPTAIACLNLSVGKAFMYSTPR